MVFQRELTLHTHSAGEMHDLADAVTRIVSELGVRTGIVQIWEAPVQSAPSNSSRACSKICRRLIPPNRNYANEQTWHDGNGHSHLQATLLGPSLTVPVRDGKPVLGTWQQIFHIECDVRPRERTVVVTVLGE